MVDPKNSARPKKKGLDAKIVKHAHRRRFQGYLRDKGRDKATIGYVYWSMFLRSGEGDRFELKEELFLADLGVGKNSFRAARKVLVDDGWLTKTAQKIDPATGKWGTVEYTVNTEAHSVGDGTLAPLTGDRSTDDGSAGDRSAGDTVVLHSLYGTDVPSTSTVSPTAVTFTESKQESKQVSLAAEPLASSAAPLRGKDENQPLLEFDGMTPENTQDPDSIFELMVDINPNMTDALAQQSYPACRRILERFDGTPQEQLVAARSVLKWNRTHRSGKYATKDDKKLYIRTAAQFLKALLSDSATLLNDYHSHTFAQCETCELSGIRNYKQVIHEMRVAEQQRLEMAALAERDARWSQYVFERTTPEQKKRLHEVVQFDISALIKSYLAQAMPSRSAEAVDAAARYFADRGTPFDREEWDWVMEDARQAVLARPKAQVAGRDLL